MTKNNDKTALVLGSSRGVGAAIANELREAGFSAPTLSSKDIDTSSRDSVEAFIKAHPVADVLVLNTGGPPKKDFCDITDDDWNKYHQQLFLSFASLLKGIEIRDGGYIFLISSHLISDPNEMMILSVAYRVASWAMLKALSKSYARRQVSCINIALGPILTDRLRNLTADLNKLQEGLPLMRAGKPEEVGKFVRTIIEKNIQYLTGSSINFDGGISSHLF
jgi:3-oxoacyl-[acyl-carrier protein] reductase